MWAIFRPRSVKTEWSVCRNVTHVWGPGTGRGLGVALTGARMPHFLQNCGISLTRSLPRYTQSLKHNATSFLHLTSPCPSARSLRWNILTAVHRTCLKVSSKTFDTRRVARWWRIYEIITHCTTFSLYKNTWVTLNEDHCFEAVEILGQL